ncbi:MAG: hypothetical protein LBS70_01905, partial [Candidatus Accumulibacter sp.]|nr:hypothetical protein [Accumulibacter sp.]
AFADVNYAYDKLLDEDLELLEKIFFDEVLLYCGPAMLTTTPPIGEGFDKDEVIKDLKLKLSNGKKGILSRLWQKVLLDFYRWTFKSDWERIRGEILRRRNHAG